MNGRMPPHLGPGMTALHSAACSGFMSTVAILSRAGAPVDHADAHGRTPLMLAAIFGNREMAQLLRDLGYARVALLLIYHEIA